MPLVITAETAHFVTLPEVKAHANVTGTTHDAELMQIRDAAEEHVESLVGPVLWRTVTETHFGASDRRYLLGTYPVVSLGSVAYDGAAFSGAVLESVGAVRGLSGYGDLTITYTAGRTECPENIRLATLIIAAHLWQTQLGNAPTRGALPTAEDAAPAFGLGYVVPARAMALLAPHLAPGGIA